MQQRGAAIWYFSAYRWLGCASGSESVSGRSVWIVLGVEGECDRKEYGERQDILGEEVGFRFLIPSLANL